MVRQKVWEELERCGATIAVVPFSGRAGAGGKAGTITLSRADGDDLVGVDRWSWRGELAYALEAPLWDRYGSFAGQPAIRGTVTWSLADRRIVIAGYRGDEAFGSSIGERVRRPLSRFAKGFLGALVCAVPDETQENDSAAGRMMLLSEAEQLALTGVGRNTAPTRKGVSARVDPRT